MRPFKRPPPLLPHCTHCPHRPLSTTATATAKRRKARAYQKQIDRTLQERASTLRTRIHESRIARREDWILGPLAPSRDLGNGEYGTLSERELKGVTRGLDRGVLTHRGRGGVTAAGQTGRKGMGVSWEESLIWEGDRVVVVSGAGPESRDRWRIGEVVEVRRGTRQVVVEGLNEVDVKTNEASSNDPNTPIIRSVQLPMPLSSVRLVHKLRDPKTGIESDKIISRLIPLPDEKKAEIRAEFKAGTIDLDEMKRRMSARTIPGSKQVYGDWLEIPIPNNTKDETPEVKEHDGDTLRFEVEQRTWVPTLLRAPMPGGVIDELRNKYSRFRTRHDASYQLMLENPARRKAEYKAWVASGGGMLMSPRREARLVEVEKLKEKGQPRLESEVLERIGEVMVRAGIEMTGKRRREMERNLRGRGERAVRWGDDVDVGGEKGAETGVLGDEDEEGDEEEWEETEVEEEEEEDARDVLIEEDKPRDEKRPTL